MRVTQEPALRKFWYCVTPLAELDNGPKAFTLLGEKIALWKDAEGKPRAVKDRCPHRTAQLSGGWVDEGKLVCPYHGWAFAGTGECVRVPQQPINGPRPFGVAAYRCEERYGYAWVALEEPLFPIPDIPETRSSDYRKIHEFTEIWACAPLRIVENSFDGSHISFVHRNTFGNIADPVPAKDELTETADGFICSNATPVINPERMRTALRTEEATTFRYTDNQFILPFFRVGRIRYPNGLINILCTAVTPVTERVTQRIQFVLRNDTEADVPAEKVIAFDREVSAEDRAVLETTDEDVPLDTSEGVELHMGSDMPGLWMRRRLRAILRPGRAAAALDGGALTA
jgi:phenylpropionate dioxygenase-like ring-hydroxylating dioxygenase large terminal subunit